MGGGLIQMVARGVEDVHITQAPEMTYWRTFYKQHTHFAIESIRQVLDGDIDYGKKVSCVVSRSGDLLHNVWLEITMTQSGQTYYPAEAVIKQVDLEIGGQLVERQHNDFMRAYDELFHSTEEKAAYRRLTNFHETENGESTNCTRTFHVPLRFFFCKDSAYALPLVALQFTDVRLSVTFATPDEVGYVTGPLKVAMYCDYVFLSTEERQFYASTDHDMLIEQVQSDADQVMHLPRANETQTGTVTLNHEMSFNHPIKYLIWMLKGDRYGYYSSASQFPWVSASSEYVTEADSAYNDVYAPLQSARLLLNGSERFSSRTGKVFNAVFPYRYCGSEPAAGIYFYPFCLHPNQMQPSGVCNFSMFESAIMTLTFKKFYGDKHFAHEIENGDTDTVSNRYNLNALRVYAVGYNVLRFRSGLAALLFSH